MENPCIRPKYTCIKELFSLKIQPNHLSSHGPCTSSFHLLMLSIRILCRQDSQQHQYQVLDLFEEPAFHFGSFPLESLIEKNNANYVVSIQRVKFEYWDKNPTPVESEQMIGAVSDLVNILAGTKIESELVFGQNSQFLRATLVSEYEELFIDAMAIHLFHFPHKTHPLVVELAELSKKICLKFPWKIDLLSMEASLNTQLITKADNVGYECLMSLKHILHYSTTSREGDESDETLFAKAKNGLKLFQSLDGQMKKEFTCLCENSVLALLISAPEQLLVNHVQQLDLAMEYILGQPRMGNEIILFEIQVLVATGRTTQAIGMLNEIIEQGIRPYTPEIPISKTISSLDREWVCNDQNRMSKSFRKSLPWFASRSEKYWKYVLKILQEEVVV